MSNLLIDSLRVKGPASVIDDPNVSYDWFELHPVVFVSQYPGCKAWSQQYDWFTVLGPNMIDYHRLGRRPTRVGPNHVGPNMIGYRKLGPNLSVLGDPKDVNA